MGAVAGLFGGAGIGYALTKGPDCDMCGPQGIVLGALGLETLHRGRHRLSVQHFVPCATVNDDHPVLDQSTHFAVQ
jgi:hypothetical protein